MSRVVYFPAKFNGKNKFVQMSRHVDFQAKSSGEPQFVFKLKAVYFFATFIRETGRFPSGFT